MYNDLLLVLIIGTIWSAIGITLTVARRRDCSIRLFYFMGSLWASIILGGYLMISDELGKFGLNKLPAVFALVIGSFLNGIGQSLIMSNLKPGACALAYAIPLLGFVLPFLWCGIFGGENINCINIAGIILMVLAISLSLSERKSKSAYESENIPRQIMIACIAMLILGTSQILITYPSMPQNISIKIPPVLSSFIIMLASTIFFGLATCLHKHNYKTKMRKVLRYSFLWGGFAVASYLLLFPVLRLMSKHGQAGIVYPVASGTSIIAFAFFTHFKLREHLGIRQIVALVMIIGGILMVKSK